MNKELTEIIGVDENGDARGKACCVHCGRYANREDFYDDESLMEFSISGLCQDCQDECFGGSPEDDIELT